MSVKRTAQQAKSNWQTSFAGSGTRYTQGVQSVKTAPGALAAAAQDKWQTNVSSASAKQSFASKVGAVTLSAWQLAATTTGVSRLSQGATKGAPKYGAFIDGFLPKLTDIVTQVESMPSTTTQDRINRAVAYMQATNKLKGTV